MARNALGLEFGSAARLSKRPGSVWNCLWGHALKISPGINRKSRVSYPGPGFLSSATWPSLPKKHYNGLNQTKLITPCTVFNCYRLQVFCTGLLGCCVVAIIDHRNQMPSPGLIPLSIGSLIITVSMSLSINAGAAMNPARDLSPRIFTAIAGWGPQVFRYAILNYEER